MTNVGGIPQSGFSLEKLYFGEQVLRIVRDDDPSIGEEQQFSLGWDWRLQDEDSFEILLNVSFSPSRTRPEEISATACGVFRVMGESTTVAMKDFARLNGPAILMPFLRECIGAMTARGYFGQMLLPPMNVHALMQSMDTESATGTRQLAARETPKSLPASPKPEGGTDAKE